MDRRVILLVTRGRHYPDADAITGTLHVDSESALELYTLERESMAIPAGTYPVTVTVSARCAAGGLWSPRKDHSLPLIGDVPGRSGIRLHAANEASQLSGCIAVGLDHTYETLEQSRAGLIALMARIDNATDAVSIVIVDAMKEAS